MNQGGMLRRVGDPLGGWRRYRWSYHDQLVYTNRGYPTDEPGRVTRHENPNNHVRWSAYDERDNLVSTMDSEGLVTGMTYDDDGRVLSVHHGQSHAGPQGDWKSEYGGDGYLLCACEDDGSDLVRLPDYVLRVDASVARVAPHASAADPKWYTRMDPRVPLAEGPGTEDESGVGSRESGARPRRLAASTPAPGSRPSPPDP